MITTLYQGYIVYRYIVAFHGIYVAFSFLKWFFGTTYEYSLWLFSFVYTFESPTPPLQIEDKKLQNNNRTEKTFRLDEPIRTL